MKSIRRIYINIAAMIHYGAQMKTLNFGVKGQGHGGWKQHTVLSVLEVLHIMPYVNLQLTYFTIKLEFLVL